MIKRKTFRLIHLYIGLVAGIIVFIEAVTGALWVFNSEISSLVDKEIVVEKQDQPVIGPTEARQVADHQFPGKGVHGVLYPNGEPKPVEVIFYEREPEFYYSLYLDPYSGEVLGGIDHNKGFFAFILDGHINLWLPPEIGEVVVSYGTLLFLFSIVTGIVLWWPKKKKVTKQRFQFDWKESTRWRRKNFDLHTVLGFYVSALALVFAITGLVMALNWFYFLYYTALGGDKAMRFIIPKNVTVNPGDSQIDKLPELLFKEFPTARDFEIHYPHSDSSSIYVEVSYKDEVYYDSDYVFFDQSTLEQVSTPSIYGKYEDAGVSEHFMRMNYDFHVGAIGGLPTKILAFLACMVIASLPVTGVLLWLGRKKKKKPVAMAYT